MEITKTEIPISLKTICRNMSSFYLPFPFLHFLCCYDTYIINRKLLNRFVLSRWRGKGRRKDELCYGIIKRTEYKYLDIGNY